MRSPSPIARELSRTILEGRLSIAWVTRCTRSHFIRPTGWIAAFARRVVARFQENQRPRHALIERFIDDDSGFRRACASSSLEPGNPRPRVFRMCPAPGAAEGWGVPPFETPGALAKWLNLEMNELAWMADCRTAEATLPPGPLRHYHYAWRKKRDGTARLIESPKLRLKLIQRAVLRQILGRIPVHSAAHGFCVGRSIKTFAQPHAGQPILLKLDLKDFFPRVSGARVFAIFMTAGYPEAVSRLLTGLCTNTVPGAVLDSWPSQGAAPLPASSRAFLRQPHLAQGAPTSPCLGNLAAYRFDCRLSGLAQASGAVYTRYADDLLFSGDEVFARGVDRFYIRVSAILLEEGFEVNTRKTRVMRRSVSQRAVGLVLNQGLNVPREDFDRLKAILHNCVRRGPSGENRTNHPDFAAHLSGRISHVEQVHPGRGRKLRDLFERIPWDQPAAS